MAFNIEEELKTLRPKPGVYLMHDERDAIIYVGKAISLKNRVRQYFQSSRNKGVKIEQMVTHIARFEYIITDSELEALVLECNLIKEHRPKYNTMLMDDKAYPFIKVTVQEDFPRVLFARQMYKDKAKYYGPYTSAAAVKDTIDLIHNGTLQFVQTAVHGCLDPGDDICAKTALCIRCADCTKTHSGCSIQQMTYHSGRSDITDRQQPFTRICRIQIAVSIFSNG